MISSPVIMQFESVLRDQHIADIPSCFADRAFFDEVPLYSRYRQIDFLKQYGDANLLLVDLALNYLERVISSFQGQRIKRFVALTFISDDDGEHVVPHIFVCNDDVERKMNGLRLGEPSEGLGKQVEELVTRARPACDFIVLEDRSTISGDVRVFVGPKSPPHGMVALGNFATGSAGNYPNK